MSKLIVKNTENVTDTEAEIIIKNEINYTPKISVIIPVYNTEKYLPQCLDSVINQTLKEIEVICVDDGSTDDSLNILKKYAEKDKRITVICQKNLYAGVARNAGLAVASGTYIHFLDSDDWLDNDSYEKMHDIINCKKVDFIKFRSYSYDNKAKKVIQNPFTDMKYIDSIFFDLMLCFEKDYKTLINVSDAPWSGLYNHSFLKKNKIFFDNLLCANDSSFYIRCLVASEKIFLSSQRFVYYRVNNDNSLIGIRPKHLDCQIKQYSIRDKILEDCPVDIIIHQRELAATAIFRRFYTYIDSSEVDKITKDKLQNEISDFIKQSPFLDELFNNFTSSVRNKTKKCYKKYILFNLITFYKIRYKENSKTHYFFNIPIFKIKE